MDGKYSISIFEALSFFYRDVNPDNCFTGLGLVIITVTGYIRIFMKPDSVESINYWWVYNVMGIVITSVGIVFTSDSHKYKVIKYTEMVLGYLSYFAGGMILLAVNTLWCWNIARKMMGK